ncbi:MAG: hypothetical protein DI536_16000 [Archangium gephyra]|uniref:Uncharacterized protein n=1 Tax=Archangium gephyra TaxID=48 RepID=A0A2W5URU5_9BACT|nr:MAG: hypothetical protein DI536_16000 [Archangium gephyra]
MVASQPLQVPPSHRESAGHDWHWAPLMPHCAVVLPSTHAPSRQQPVQVDGEQVLPPASGRPASTVPASRGPEPASARSQ